MWLDNAPEIKKWLEATDEAFKDPQRGDSFDEMLTFRMFVLDVQTDGGPVTVVEANPPCVLPRDGKLRRFASAHEFRAAYAYGSTSGYWVGLNKRGVDVDGWLAYLAAEQEGATVAGEVAQARTMSTGPDIHPPTPEDEPMLRFFTWAHLPPRLQRYSRPFADLADEMVRDLPRTPERTKLLNELLYAKDWAVRAALDLPS